MLWIWRLSQPRSPGIWKCLRWARTCSHGGPAGAGGELVDLCRLFVSFIPFGGSFLWVDGWNGG